MGLVKIVNKILTRIEIYKKRRKINWIATLYVNYRLFPFNVAKIFPIYVYGKVKILMLQGSCSFKGVKPERGMVKIGRHIDNYMSNDVVIISIERESELRFCGKCSIATGSILRLSHGCELIFGNKVWIGQGVLIDCNKLIKIGDFSSITYNCRISDSNHHYIWDSVTHKVKNKDGEIKIGKYNWIGNNCTIDKGTDTPDWTIVTHNSILNKKYISDINKTIVLAGSPAKIIGYNKRRIFNSEIEKTINNLFVKFCNSSEVIFALEDDMVEDKFFD